MTNLERIQKLTAEEFAKECTVKCRVCVNRYVECKHESCNEGVVEWLSKDVEAPNNGYKGADEE